MKNISNPVKFHTVKQCNSIKKEIYKILAKKDTFNELFLRLYKLNMIYDHNCATN